MGDEAKAKGNAVVRATVDIYNTIRRELLPTPAKSHYTYNMRDMSKVFQVPLPHSQYWRQRQLQ